MRTENIHATLKLRTISFRHSHSHR